MVNTGYNYFRHSAVKGLIQLAYGIDQEHASPAQLELAEQIVENIERYGASLNGSWRPTQ